MSQLIRIQQNDMYKFDVDIIRWNVSSFFPLLTKGAKAGPISLDLNLF